MPQVRRLLWCELAQPEFFDPVFFMGPSRAVTRAQARMEQEETEALMESELSDDGRPPSPSLPSNPSLDSLPPNDENAHSPSSSDSETSSHSAMSRTTSHDGALYRYTAKQPAAITVAKPTVVHIDALRYMQDIYFASRSITDAEEKKRIVVDEGFTHDVAFAWLRTNRTRLLALAWDDVKDEQGKITAVSPFWDALLIKFVGRHWESEHASARNKLRLGTGRGEGPFQELIDAYESYNRRLAGTDFFFEDTQIKTHIQINLPDAFLRHINHEKVDSRLPYQEWKDAVLEAARFYEPPVVPQAQGKRASNSDHYEHGRSQYRKTFNDSTNDSSRPSSRDSSRGPGDSHPMGPMVDFVKDSLRERKGCYRCREYHSTHTARACPHRFIKLDHEYRALDEADLKFIDRKHNETGAPVTLNDVLAAKHEREGRKGRKAVAVVSRISEGFEEEQENLSVSRTPGSSNAVAAVYGGLPLTHHASGPAVFDKYARPAVAARVAAVKAGDRAILASQWGSDEDSESDSSFSKGKGKGRARERTVSFSSEDSPAPFFLPHMYWTASLLGPAVETPLEEDCLLDDGCGFVLIRADLVTRLGLKTRRLHQPQVLDVAMSRDEATRVIASEYCTIAPEDPSRKWFSSPVRALIVPVLCASVILGLPFLARNEIVIDYSARTVVARPSGFDLLHPESFVVCPTRPTVSPPVQRRKEADEIRKGRAAVRKGFASVLEEIQVL
ncbi:hypothetical protein EV360DRAFT_90680, partial [Lentinula raphanica]